VTEILSDTTQLANARTDMALERSVMAAERTLLAWIRTALALISFGFTLGKLAQALDSATVRLLPGREMDIVGVAYYLVVLGTLALVVAAVQNRIEVRALARQGVTRRPGLAFLVAVLLSVFGMFAFTDLVTRF